MIYRADTYSVAEKQYAVSFQMAFRMKNNCGGNKPAWLFSS